MRNLDNFEDIAREYGLWFVLLLFVIGLSWLHIINLTDANTTDREQNQQRASNRFKDLKKTIAEGITIFGIAEIREISIDSFEIRKLKRGFISIGALNQAVIQGLNITLSEEYLSEIASKKHSEFTNSGHQALNVNSDLIPTSMQGEAKLPRFLDTLKAGSAFREQSISSIVISNLSFSVEFGTNKRTEMTRCDRIAISEEVGKDHRIDLQGNVRLQSMAGEIIECQSARITISTNSPPTISVSNANLISSSETQKLETLSMPLTWFINGTTANKD